MGMKDGIRKLAFSAMAAALSATILLIGSAFDMLDLACAAAASLIVHVILQETDVMHAFLVFASSFAVSFILMPMRSCSILFAFFFGYYPILRWYVRKYIKFKPLRLIIYFTVFNAAMVCLFFLFKGLFGLAGEPVYLYILLIISSNVFFACFEMLTGKIMILYNYRIKNKIFNKNNNKKEKDDADKKRNFRP